MWRNLYVKLIYGLVFLLCLSMAACIQPLAGSSGLNANPQMAKLVGAWQVETTVVQQATTFPALLTFTSDGIVLADEPPSPFETTGHGNWAATGPDTANFTFVALIGSAEGPLSATIKVVGTLQYDASADAWNGSFTVQVTDPQGAELLVDSGTFEGTRIAIETLASAESQGTSAPVEFVRKIDTSAQQIQNPISVAVDGEGNVYISESSENPRVLKYNSQGEFVLAWGSRGSGEGQFEFLPPTPDAGPGTGFIATDGEGNVYVSDGYNFRVQKFDPEGNFLMQFGAQGSDEGQFDDPAAGPISVDSQDNIYVSTFPRVQKFDAEGNFVAAYGRAGDGEGQFNGAAFGAIDSQGNLYIADLLNARVQKLDADGNFLMQWGRSGTDAGQFNLPVTVVLDSVGRLYVADNTNRIQIFDSDGNFLGEWSESGGDNNSPLGGEISGLAIDDQDNIYVADAASPSIYIFQPR